MINFRVGILGAGKIAGIIADTLNKLDGFEPYAIASRDLKKANEFADEYNIVKRYGSYEELAQDPDVELIYIATPHSHHAEQAKMCINAGKPVLVEKAFSYDAKTTEEVLKLSEEKQVFAGEAMWIRFLPMYHLMIDNIKKGAIGNVNNITCSLGYDLRKKERVTKPELAGGALLDLGVYPINLVSMIYGTEPAAIASSCARLQTGVDAQSVIQFNFKGAKSANVFFTMMYEADNNARIYGDRGYIEVDNINNPSSFRIYQLDKKLVFETQIPSRQITGYEFQFMAARDAIITGKFETPEMPHAETLRLMKFYDTLRRTWKIRFPMDEPWEDPQPTPGPGPIKA